VDRLACVDLPAFPLQLLLLDHTEWRDHPTVVVERDRPQGKILWANPHAIRLGVRAGMRYAAGLSLAAELRAGVISTERIAQGVALVAAHLHQFSPEVEAFEEIPGVFWVNASGLRRLYPQPKVWGDRLRLHLYAQGFDSVVVVGWTRFGTFALARAFRFPVAQRRNPPHRSGAEPVRAAEPGRARPEGTWVLYSSKHEAHASCTVALERLHLSPKSRDILEQLGVYTVGQLLSLPAGGLRDRFGVEILQFHRLASGQDPLPLQPMTVVEPLEAATDLEPPVANITRLVFHFSHLLHPLMEKLAAQGYALAQLEFSLRLEEGPKAPTGSPPTTRLIQQWLRPAAPTLNASQLLHLLLLRLEQLELAVPVEQIALKVLGVTATEEQLLLFVQEPRRDLHAANRALARVRAEFGNGSVVCAELRDGHLPEACFCWKPVDRVPLPAVGSETLAPAPLVRRIHACPVPLPPRPRVEPDGWLLAELEAGPVIKNTGPFIFSGGWWHRLIQREYYFAELRRGDIAWVYYDARRKRWYLHGAVE
jgi:protein ImuB